MKPGLPHSYDSDELIPESIHGYISVAGARTIFGKPLLKCPKSTKPFHARAVDRANVRRGVEKQGFEVLAESPLGLTVVADCRAWEELTGAKIKTVERLMRVSGGYSRYATHLQFIGKGQPAGLCIGRAKSKKLKSDFLFLDRPRVCYANMPAPIPPNVGTLHLTLPDGVSTGLSANQAHQKGIRGTGVRVAMVDTGLYRHPYFIARNYDIKTPLAIVPGTSPADDPAGHGTGHSANIFAVAPGANLQPLRASDNNGTIVVGRSAFNIAVQMNPQIITCSWGSSDPYPPGVPSVDEHGQMLEILYAIEKGISVVYAAGNGQFAFEPQVPGVISAGGVFWGPNSTLVASNYSSGYSSPWFTDPRGGPVVVPWISGLVGQQPRADYLMLPVPPGSYVDGRMSGPDEYGNPGDGTLPDDGWALFSGTSAAAPQIAGAIALLLEVKPGLNPAQVAEALAATAIDVTAGISSPPFNSPAGVGRDLATGFGLVNSSAAVEYAMSKF